MPIDWRAFSGKPKCSRPEPSAHSRRSPTVEKTPDFTALIMELVEGDDLSQRIARGAIPIDEALAHREADYGCACSRTMRLAHAPDDTRVVAM